MWCAQKSAKIIIKIMLGSSMIVLPLETCFSGHALGLALTSEPTRVWGRGVSVLHFSQLSDHYRDDFTSVLGRINRQNIIIYILFSVVNRNKLNVGKGQRPSERTEPRIQIEIQDGASM